MRRRRDPAPPPPLERLTTRARTTEPTPMSEVAADGPEAADRFFPFRVLRRRGRRRGLWTTHLPAGRILTRADRRQGTRPDVAASLGVLGDEDVLAIGQPVYRPPRA